MFTVKTILGEIKIVHCLGGVVLPHQINVTLEEKILAKNICVGKVQTFVLTVRNFAPLPNVLFLLSLLYMELHTHFYLVHDDAGDYQNTQHIFAIRLA